MQSLSDEPKTFTLFPKLPPELQEAIWACTIDWKPHVLPRPPIPELSVCRQSREVLLKIYRPCFHSYPNERTNKIQFPNGPGLAIRGMGRPFPRSPYANYTNDILYINASFSFLVYKAGSCKIFLFQEAIDNIENLVTWHSDWPHTDQRHERLPGPRPVDLKLPITHFGGLKVVYISKKPKLIVDSPRSNQDLRPAAMVARFQAKNPDARKTFNATEKILIPQGEFDQDPDNSRDMTLAKQWVERQSTAFPGWKVPDLQFAKLIPDPRG